MSSSKASPTITVLYFAAASTSVGLTSEQITLPLNEPDAKYPLSSLPSLILSLHPAAPNLKQILETSQWSVNVEMVDNDDLDKVELKGGEEVAVICPVSGG
ncbi:hypothetical protein VKT23_011402 [Stygiomarasmius scandens]|uniref:Sulfur carrier protein MOCS2A n=1 Tax=Marasmiellus scandens TaxID=2682957 RepID=A0ABR1JBZ5_9AGAR